MPSHAITHYAYAEERNELTVTFANGKTYVYSLVPASVAAALDAAPSKGAYINAHVRDRYAYRRAASAGSATVDLRDALQASARDTG